MAGKQTGLGAALFVAGVDLSGDTQSLGRIGGGPAALDMTSIDKSAFERKGGVRDGGMDVVSYFNPDSAHPVYSALPTSDVIATYCHTTALGAPAAAMVAKQIGYDPTRPQDGSLTCAVALVPNGFGLEWCIQATAGKRTDTAATNGTGVDLAQSTAFGLQAYLHVVAFAGTSVTVKLQESADNGSGDAWADVVGGAFTAATGVTSQRIQTARDLTVERWLRVVTTGTFTNAVFAVCVAKNLTAVEF